MGGNKRDILKKGHFWVREKPGVRENPRNTQGRPPTKTPNNSGKCALTGHLL